MIKKMIIIFIFIIIGTGCTAEYNLNINKDLIIDETITLKESIFNIKKQELDVNFFVDLNIDRYRSDDRYSMYMYNKDIDSNNASVTANAIYLDLLTYKNTSPLIENLFSNFNIIKTENIYEFEYKAKSLNNVEIFDASDLYASLVEEIKVNIKLPFRVLNHNADMFNEDIGIYTWEYSNRKPTKNIIIEFDTSKMKVGNTEKGLYFLLGFVIIIGALIGYVYYKYKLHERV